MNIINLILSFCENNNILDLLLILATASAFIVYFFQKLNEKRVAATLILDQIDTIDRVIKRLKEDYIKNGKKLDDDTMYLSEEIPYNGAWDKYQYLVIKKLTEKEHELMQQYFEKAYRIEKCRADIIFNFKLSWKHKSLVQFLIYGKLYDPTFEIGNNILEKFKIEAQENQKNDYRKLLYNKYINDTVDTATYKPSIAYNYLYSSLDNYVGLSGTTAYEKLYKMSYRNK